MRNPFKRKFVKLNRDEEDFLESESKKAYMEEAVKCAREKARKEAREDYE